jgi:DNA (cytosine-5)-methyltransferase 3A
MNVLSLFDGMSCGQIALNRAGIKYDNYFASEIDKWAIQVTMNNFPNTIQLGDVEKLNTINLPKIDLLIGGSPCQGFSFAGKGLNFDDPRSKLFFIYVRILAELRKVNPDIKFLLENVDMKKEYLRVISEHLGVFPVKINSALLSAQNRERWYWTNIRTKHVGLFSEVYTDIPQPEDKGILLRDILQPESEVDKKYYISNVALQRILRTKYSYRPQINPDKTGTLNTKNNSGQLSTDNGTTLIIADKGLGHKPKLFNDKTPPLQSRPGCAHDIKVSSGFVNDNGTLRAIEKGMALDANYSKGIDNHHQRTIIQVNKNNESAGNQPYQQNRIYDINGISPALLNDMGPGSHAICIDLKTASGKSKTRRGGVSKTKSQTLDQDCYNGILKDNAIRRLTPIECERLQTVPDNYTSCVSDSQRYKMLGNGWTVDIIAHILSYY